MKLVAVALVVAASTAHADSRFQLPPPVFEPVRPPRAAPVVDTGADAQLVLSLAIAGAVVGTVFGARVVERIEYGRHPHRARPSSSSHSRSSPRRRQ